MDEQEIEKALTAGGICERCNGDGLAWRSDDAGNGRNETCAGCDGTGRDPHAVLRATQAVGWMLRRLVSAQTVNVHYSAAGMFGATGGEAQHLAETIARHVDRATGGKKDGAQ